ncbi:MAG TPA: LptF/LptG family permease [Pyrinomonadaceae bacterium]|jgi:LPS export ABC transporter permease LptF/LPS export ABC transporter permease LptG|nr:LptF/LptG family permease [Pyrinomonadaceae bacterium]
MFSSHRLIERYILGALLPYLLLALLLLTATLMGQQAGRFGELLMGTGVPLPLVWEITVALIPNVLSFTLPMAMLAGTMIGFSRMGSDSELVSMRAAGIGTWRLLWPVLLLGAVLSFATLFINFNLLPEAARTLRQAGLHAALYKLDSPIEPRSFNAEIPGYVVYVRDGDKSQGRWGRVFIYSRDADGATRLVTARSGRIDSAAEQSELVLSDAVATRIPATAAVEREYVTERLAQLRIVFNTGRKAVLDELRRDEAKPDEMGWRELRAYAAAGTGTEGRDAATLLQKRLTLSAAPLVFALLGVALGLRVRKGGRGMGVLLSLVTMVAYYLLLIMGEQLARAGTAPVVAATWLATFVTVAYSLSLLLLRRGRLMGFLHYRRGSEERAAPVGAKQGALKEREEDRRGWRARLLGFPSLLDMSLLRMLTLSFIYAFVTLTAIFIIFTLFELWRFIATTGAGASLIARYVLFLLPLLSVELLPASVLLAMLATYALMARRSEAVAWWACGQSVYRLVLPGLLFAAAAGAGAWLIQERLMPQSNFKQEALRAQIRGGVARATTPVGRQWLAATGNGRLYAYEYDDEVAALKDLVIYDFDEEGVHLRQAVRARQAVWLSPAQMELREVETLVFRGAGTERKGAARMLLGGAEPEEVFRPGTDKPSYLNAKQLSAYIKSVKRRGGSGVASLAVALQRKYADPLSALVMALIGIPLALAFGRRSAIIALCTALAIGLGFRAITGGFTQLAVYELLPAAVAAWAPPVIFASVGIYLLFRART